MTPNADEFNSILNEINAKIDYISSHNDRQAIDELKTQVGNLEKNFNEQILNFNFEKETVFENIQKEITSIIEKSAILKDLFPQEDNAKFQSVENTITANLSKVHSDLADTIKQDFNQVAQGIGALYSRIEILKNSVENKQELEAVRSDINQIGNRMMEIREVINQSLGQNLNTIIDSLNVSQSRIANVYNELKQRSDAHLDVIIENIAQSEQVINAISAELKQIASGNISSVIENIKNNETRLLEIRDELKQSAGGNLAVIIENINKNETNINNLREDLDTNIGTVIQKIQNTDDSIVQFKENIAENLTTYLNSIKDMFASFSEEMQEHHQTLTSDIFEKKLQELDVLSKDISSLSDNINVTEESYKVLLNSKILELYDYIKTLEDAVNSVNLGVGNSLAEASEIKKYITNTAIRLDEIHSKLSSDINSGSEKLDELKDIVSQNFSDVGMKLGAVQDNIGNVVNENFDEIKSILEFLRTNIPQYSGNLSEKFSQISPQLSEEIKDLTDKKLTEIHEFLTGLENVISSTNLNLDNSLAEITDIKEYIANTSLKLDDIGTNIIENITESRENFDEFKGIVTPRLDSIASKLFTMEDNLTQEISGKISEFEQTKDEATIEVNNNINELKTIVECLRANISQSTTNISENFENFENTISEKFDELSKFNEEQNTNANEIIDLINSLATEVQQSREQLDNLKAITGENLNGEALENIHSVLEKLTETSENFSDKLNETGAFFVEKFNEIGHKNEEQTNNTEEIKDLITNLDYEIKEAKSQIDAIKIPDNEELNTGLIDLKSVLDELSTSTENLSEKINEIGTFFVEKFNEIGNKHEEQVTNVDEIKELITNLSTENKSETEEICTEIADVKTSLSEISENSTMVSDKINELGSTFVEKFEEIYNRDDEQKNDTTEIKSLLNYISDEIEKTQGNISDSIVHTAKGKEEVFARIEDIKEHISYVKTAIADLHTETGDKIVEKLFAIESKLYDSTENYTQNLDQLQSKINDYANNVELISEETHSKLNDAAAEFVDIKNNLAEIQDKITYLNTDQKSFFEENLVSIVDKIEDLTNNLTAHREEIKLDIKEVVKENIMFVDKGLEYLTMTLDEIKTRQSDNADEIVNTVASKLTDIKQEIELLNTDVNEAYQQKSDAIIKEFEPLKTAILDFTSFDFNVIINEMKNQIELSYLNLLQELNNNLIENHDTYINIEKTYKDVVSKCTALQNCVDDFSKNNLELINSTIAGLDLNVRSNLEKTDNFLSEWKEYAANLEKTLSENNKDLEHSMLNVLEELQKTIDEKVKAGSSELKDFLAVMLNNEDLMLTIESLNGDVINEINLFKNSLENKNKEVEDSISTIGKNINDKLNEISLELMDKPDEEEQLTKFANLLKAALQELHNSVMSKLELLSSGNNNVSKEDLSGLANSLKELHSKVDILALNNDDNLQEDILDITEKLNKNNELDSKISDMLENLHKKLENLTFLGTNENEENLLQINKNFEKTSEFDKKVSDMLETLNSKVDILAMSDDEDLREDISDISEKLNKTAENDKKISDILENLHNKIDNLTTVETNEKDETIAKTSEFDKKVSDMLETLNSKVDILAMSDDSELRDEIEDVKDLVIGQRKLIESFDSTKKAQEVDGCLQKLLNELNNLDLDKNTQELKDSIMSAIISVADQITFVEETEEIKDFVEEKTNAINATLLDVKKQLNSIASNGSDMDLYSYTLQDVESDIAKLRIAINEISSSSPSDEVAVISTNINRIAKSIDDLKITFTMAQNEEGLGSLEKLNEDIVSISARTNKLLMNSDESYRMICDSMDEFNRRTEYLQAQLDAINSQNLQQQLYTIDKKVNATMSSSKVLENVMMYLGEWMDGTTDVVNSIYDKTAKSGSIQQAITELKENLPEKEELVSIIENKFNEQQARIDRLEKKLEKAVTMLEEREADTVQNKIDKIEKQLAKLSSNIEKLTSYVDE